MPKTSLKPVKSPKVNQDSLRTIHASAVRVYEEFSKRAKEALEALPDGWYHGDLENDIHIQGKHGIPVRYMALRKEGAEFRMFQDEDCIAPDPAVDESEVRAEIAENLPDVSAGKVWHDFFGSLTAQEVIELAGFAGSATCLPL